MTATALIDVIFEPRSIRAHENEAVRLIVDALGAGPECIADADRDATPSVTNNAWDAALADAGPTVLLCAITNLRPALATAARHLAIWSEAHPDTNPVLRIVCAGGPDGEFAAEDAYLAGICARLALDELTMFATLSEAAGFAMAAAQAYDTDLMGVSAGAAARDLTPAELGNSARRDCFGAVPRLA